MTDIFSRIHIKQNLPVKGFSSFKIGGNVRFFTVVNSVDEIRACLDFASQFGVGVFILGAGTNVLFGDGLLNYFFIKLGKGFSYIREDSSGLVVGAAVPVARLVQMYSLDLSVFSGLPGTVGAAVKGNSGVRIAGEYVSFLDMCKRVSVLSFSGEIYSLDVEDLSKAYRRSGIDGIILDVLVVPECLDRFKGVIPQRPVVEPFPNIGCIFKNPSKDLPAGKLIDSLGFKGYRVGDAMVSQIHANFILNVGEARFCDVLALIEKIASEVRRQRGIELELEIQVVK